MVCDNILEYIGHTPMVRLNRMTDPGDAEVLVKYEGLNVGGSIKTRTAFNMIKQAKKDGLIDDDKLQEIQAVIIRAVNTTDAMTAEVEDIPFDLMKRLVERITTEVKGVNRVLYDFTPKPTGTIEYE